MMQFLYRMQKENRFKPLLVAALLFICISALSFVLLRGRHPLFAVAWALVYAAAGYAIFWTGRISFYRKILFISFALLFLSATKLFIGAAPLLCPGTACPVSIPATSLSLAFNTLLQPGNWLFLLPAALWLALVLFAGRLWCAWACPFGGIDELFSSLARRPRISLLKWHTVFAELPAAILLCSMFATLSSGVAVFCAWVCPLKLPGSLLSATPSLRFLQVAAAVSTGTVFLVALPLLSKKRTFCRFICPLRGLLRWTAHAHPLRLLINPDKCTRCGKCAERCPSLAIDRKSLAVSPYCSFCLTCVEQCAAGAVETAPQTPLLLFFSLALGGAVSASFLAYLFGAL